LYDTNGKESDNWERWFTLMDSSCRAHAVKSLISSTGNVRASKEKPLRSKERTGNKLMGHGFEPVTQ